MVVKKTYLMTSPLKLQTLFQTNIVNKSRLKNRILMGQDALPAQTLGDSNGLLSGIRGKGHFKLIGHSGASQKVHTRAKDVRLHSSLVMHDGIT